MGKSDFEIRRLFGEMPFRELTSRAYKKIKQTIFDRLDKYRTLRMRSEMSDEELVNSLDGCVLSARDFVRGFRNRQANEGRPKFFINPIEQSKIVRVLEKEFSKDIVGGAIKEADKICLHIFDLLGSGEVKLGNKINWHCDFKSGYQWNPKKYYKDIKIPYGKADIKVPWELSRFQHFATLGQAYWLTNDEKYVREFVNQISDWIDNNKPNFGVNWRCTMDVAIRTCNWLLGWEFFRDSNVIDQQFLSKFLKSLHQHGRHIQNNLEWSETLPSNHYLSDIVGLVYLGVLIPEFKESKKWKSFGMEQLKKEMKKQVYPDGVDFEASTCYHRLVLELFFYATLLVIINDKNFKEDNFIEVGNEIFGQEYLQRLYKMFEFVLYALKPNGRMPQIGDNDNGRLHIFTKREVLDIRYLLTLGSIFFEEPRFKIKEFGFCEQALWVFGEEGYKIWQNLKDNCLANVGSRAFPDTGWYIMRNDKNYMFISCGPNGQNGNGAHCHNDKLSFELCIDGKDIIVDPGTYVYTPKPEWRNKFRSTVYHNTVMVDDKEQNRFSEKNLFQVENNIITKCLKWEIGDEIDVFIGEHYGYKRFSRSVIHQREIKFHKKEGKLEIIDRFHEEGEHNLEWNLILSPEFRRNLNIGSGELQWHREPVFYSPEYGTITKTEKLTSTLKTTIPVEVKFWLKIQRRNNA